MTDPLSAADLAPAHRGGRRHLTFDNGRSEDYDSVFVQHQSGEWDRILIARDDGRVAQLLADLINAAALPVREDEPTGIDVRMAALERVAEAALKVVVLPPHNDAYSTEDRRRIWTNELSDTLNGLPFVDGRLTREASHVR